MYLSEYNVFVDLDDYPDLSIIQNTFHGRAAVIPRSLAKHLRVHGSEKLSLISPELVGTLIDKGFMYRQKEKENELIDTIYSELKNTLPAANPSRQYQILLTYDCNLRCIYCFQKKVRRSTDDILISGERLNKIFDIILSKEKENEIEVTERNLPTRVPLLSIVGGEPLLDTPHQKALIASIIKFVKHNNFNYSITTNGVFLDRYIPLFKDLEYLPRNIQVTIDGTKEYHDRRRIRVGGLGSFDSIVESVDSALSEGARISIRINIDDMNIESINQIADFMIEKGWTNHNEFSAYLAPVTDHSAVNRNYKWIKKDSSIISRIVGMFKARPELENVFTMKNFRGFQYVKRIALKEGEAVPTIWRCEAVLGQLVFDPLGDLYTCFEGAGNEKAKIGTYSPSYKTNKKREQQWKELNAITNKYCSSCSNRFVCSGGCPWYIVGQEATECLPVKEEIKIAWNYYAPRVLRQLNVAEND